MIALDIKLDARSLKRLGLLASVSRLTAAQSLTFTAERAVLAWRAGNRLAFHMRRNWIDKGVRLKAATPGRLVAQVGSIDRYMGRHVEGADEEKRGSLFIPVYDRIADVRTHTQMRRTLQSADDSSRKTFHITTAGGKVLIVRRKGKARNPLQILGVLQDGAHVRPRLPAVGIVEGVVAVEFGPIYERLLLKWAERG